MREQFERTIGDIANSPLRIAIVAVCFGLSAGLLGYLIHIFAMRMNVSPQAQTGIETALLCCAAALAPFLLLIAARERRRLVVDDLRRIVQRVLSVALRNWGRFYAPASFARRRRKGARLRLRSSTEKASGSKWSPSHSSSSSC